MKLLSVLFTPPCGGRTPHGVRELKLILLMRLRILMQVAPRTGCVN